MWANLQRIVEKRGRTGKKGVGDTLEGGDTRVKAIKSDKAMSKKGQLPPRVSPTLVTPLHTVPKLKRTCSRKTKNTWSQWSQSGGWKGRRTMVEKVCGKDEF